MKPNLFTYWEATKIGFSFSAGVTLLLLIFWPVSMSFKIFAMNAPVIIFLFGITGALLGKLLAKTRKGIWFGAGIMLLLLGLWLYSIAINTPLD